MGNQLPNPDKNFRYRQYRNQTMRSMVGTMQGWKRTMQDNYYINLNLNTNHQIGILGVFDSHGTPLQSYFLSLYLEQVILTSKDFLVRNQISLLQNIWIRFEQLILSKLGKEILDGAYQFKSSDFSQTELTRYFSNLSNKDFGQQIQTTENVPNEYHMYGGCVGVITLFFKDRIIVSHLGNCRVFIIERPDEQFTVVKNTKNHVPISIKENERIKDNNGYISGEKLLGNLHVSRSVGNFRQKSKGSYGTLINNDPEVFEYEFNVFSEYILIGTDGMFDKWDENQILKQMFEEFEKGTEIDEIIDKYFHKICPDFIEGSENKGLDNMTCAIIDLNKNRTMRGLQRPKKYLVKIQQKFLK